MITSLALILTFILLILSGIHYSWVFGGTWGFAQSLPTNEEGKRVLNPRKIESAVVATGLLLFAFFFFIKSGLTNFYVPNWIANYFGWVISSIFTLRAIGDFKYVGFFKKIKDTEFGKKDTQLFSPLCLGMGVIGFILELI